MTQVVSACAALGYTWDESNKMYQALYSLTK
nr:MAG TPA: UBA-like domain protein [Caudoviricetes sp.]